MQEIETWYLYGLFAFFSTFSVYNGQRLIKSTQPTQTLWLLWVQRNEKSLYLATFASGLLTISSLLFIGKISPGAVLLLSVSGVVSLFYVIPIKGVIMREIPHIKIYLIAMTWAVVLILFPMINEEKFVWNIALHALAHTFYIISVAIPFDIRDVKFDRNSHKTIPQVVGIRSAKIVSITLLTAFFVIMVMFEPQLIYAPVFYIAAGAQYVLLLYMNENRGDLYCAGAIDGVIGLVGISYFFAKMSW